MVFPRGQNRFEALNGLHCNELPPRLQHIAGLDLRLGLFEAHCQQRALICVVATSDDK